MAHNQTDSFLTILKNLIISSFTTLQTTLTNIINIITNSSTSANQLTEIARLDSIIQNTSSLKDSAINDDAVTDSFGRLRVSNTNTIIDLKQLGDNGSRYYDTVTNGTGTSVYNANTSSTILSVSVNGDYAIRQSYQRGNYQSGKSLLVMMSFQGFLPQTGVNKRVGYFTSDTAAPYIIRNGIFLHSDPTQVSLVKALNGVESSFPQSGWNIDRMDGTGISGINVDWNSCQILVMDLQWLGVGRVRCGLDIDGKIYYFHEFLNANNTTDVYIKSPNLPIRYEISSIGGVGSLKQICGTIINEGGLDNVGSPSSIYTNGLLGLNTGTTYSVLRIRKQSTSIDRRVVIKDIDILSGTNDSLRWFICLNPTVAGTSIFSAVNNSFVEANLGDITNTVSSLGTVLKSGLAYADTQINISDILSEIDMGISIAGTRDVIALCIAPISSGLTVYGTVNILNIM